MSIKSSINRKIDIMLGLCNPD